MKFNDGYWLLREGVTARYATEALDLTTTPESASLAVPDEVKHVAGLAKMLAERSAAGTSQRHHFNPSGLFQRSQS